MEAFFKQRRVSVWLAVASQIMTASQMSPGLATLIVLALNALTLWLALRLARIETAGGA